MNKTSLYDLHLEQGASMVPLAGYSMPLQYRAGAVDEHRHTRSAASLFELSPMGQIEVSGAQVLAELEMLLPLDLEKISLSQMAYSFLPNAQGGVIDDLIITRRNRDNFLLRVNAICKDKVVEYLTQHLKTSPVHVLDDLSLLSLQGPKALDVLSQVFHGEIANLPFMYGMLLKFQQIECFVSRCGYSGEDGFEISLASVHAERLLRHLLAFKDVKMAGLAARDSLRLEAGLCAYGRELDETTCPIAAGLGWTIAKSRRSGGKKQGNFVGSDILLHRLAKGVAQKRVGLVVQATLSLPEGAMLHDSQGFEVGEITSCLYSPSLNLPIAMAYVDERLSAGGTELSSKVNGEDILLTVTELPFVARHRAAKKKPLL